MRKPEEIDSLDPKGRFTGRVGAYARARPGYPDALIGALAAECGLRAGARVADIGSGTGILTRLLLECGAGVAAVEPNAAMRREAEKALGGAPGFRSVDGSAEATGLEAGSIGLIVAAQAFHWFRQEEARREFLRILRPGGSAALIWNERHATGTPFLEAYEAFLREYSTDYKQSDHRNIRESDIRAFLGPEGAGYREFPNRQDLDADGLRDRVLSSSYLPGEGHPRRAAMLDRLDAIFREYQDGGRVAILYRTRLWSGRFGAEVAQR